MSYSLVDSAGVLTEFASIGGYADFVNWAMQQDSVIRRFAHFGFSEDLQELHDALQAVQAPMKVKEQKEAVQECALKAKDVLIVSDGMSDEPEPRTAAASPIESAADSFHKKLLVAIQYAFAKGREAIDKPALREATTLEEASRAVATAPEAVRTALQEVVPHLLQRMYAAGRGVALDALKLRVGELRSADDFFDVSFDRPDRRAAAWARKHTADLLDGLSDTTRQDIAEAIAQAQEDGDLHEAYDTILQAVGDDDRAQLITQHQSMLAVNSGQREAWEEAQQKGLLDAGTERIWMAADGCCDLCEELDGERAPLEGTYPGGSDGPPLHPRCRCTEGLAL